MVVIVVVAVAGRSPVAAEIAASDDAGIFPVSSSLLILDLRSSNSSQTVDGAFVDTVDIVPSTRGVTIDASCSVLDIDRTMSGDDSCCPFVVRDKLDSL